MDRISPGDVCIMIWSKMPENVGAILTVVTRGTGINEGRWTFKDASRPLALFSRRDGRFTGYASESRLNEDGSTQWVLDSQLVPIKPVPGEKDVTEDVPISDTTE